MACENIHLPANPVCANTCLAVWDAMKMFAQNRTGHTENFLGICQGYAAVKMNATRWLLISLPSLKVTRCREVAVLTMLGSHTLAVILSASEGSLADFWGIPMVFPLDIFNLLIYNLTG